MASLNTLRTKYGIVLSVVIALVLVAFILGDQLSMRNRKQDIEDNTVLTIDGKAIKQSEYYEYKQQYGVEGADADANASNIYMQILFTEYLHPQYEAAGVGYIAENETVLRDMIAKNYIKTMVTPGEKSAKEIAEEINNTWDYFKYMRGGDLTPYISTMKAIEAYSAGKYANSLQVNEELRNANLTFDGRYVMLPYSAITCDEATETEIEAYYKANRKENVNYGARTLSYVRFNIAPSEADKAAAEAAVMEADAKAKAAEDSKGIKNALRGVNGKIENYVAMSSLTEDEAKAIKAGENYGPVLNRNMWTAKYIVSKVTAPASYTFSAITAESNIDANALVEEIKAVNGNLSEIEAGANATTKTIEMVTLNERTAEKFVNAKVGDVFVHTVDNKPAAIIITELGKKDNFVLTANVNYEVVASPETHSEVNAKANDLMKNAGKTPEAFTAAVQEIGLFAIPTTVTRNADPSQVEPIVFGIEDSRNIAIWAYDAKVGDKKSWSAKNVTYVCMITGINDQKYEAKNEDAIKRILENEKKFQATKNTLTMESNVDGLKSGKFEGVNFGSEFVGELSDAKVASAIARSTKEGEPTIVKGNTGVYVFVVDKINNTDAVVNANVEAKRKEMTEAQKSMANYYFMNNMLDGVKIVDKRGVSEL